MPFPLAVPAPFSNPRPHHALAKPHERQGAFTLAKLRERGRAFTLVELLVVVGIIVVLMLLLVPAFTSLKSAGDITSAAYTIKGALEQARAYAMANSTYTWVGFYEESATATTPTNVAPPYPGKGRLLIATVFSTDGTKIFEDTDVSAPLPPARVRQIGKLTKIEGIHVTDVGPPPSPPPSPTPAPDSFDGRPNLPYAEGSPFDHYNRISSDNPNGKQVSGDQTKFPFSTQDYTFYKTIRFSPRGEANINSTYTFKHLAEIGLIQTHGDAAPTPPSGTGTYSGSPVAIQFSAVGGNLKIYTR